MAEEKLSEELRHCMEDEECGDCEFRPTRAVTICRPLLQKAYERIKEFEEMEDRKNENARIIKHKNI